jgi:hypothetical protein
MKIEEVRAAVDRLHTTECRGTVVNSEALKELRALLTTPVIEHQVEPFGYWMHPKDLPHLGMFHKPDPDIESASVKEAFVAVRLYAEQPEIAALREELERAKLQNAELEKDRDAWRRRSSHRLADCQEMMGALKEIERDTTDADSRELATKTIAEILLRAKSNEQPVKI